MKAERIPEERAVEVFAPKSPDQSFNEGMRHRGVQHGFEFLDLEDPKVGEPPVESEQRIVIGADPRRWRIAGNDLVAAKQDRLAAKQSDAPEIVFGVRKEGQPGRTRGIWVSARKVLRENAACLRPSACAFRASRRRSASVKRMRRPPRRPFSSRFSS